MIVILHGILGSKSNWATPAKLMVETAGPLGWSALLLDHRGHGSSPGGEAPHNLEACAQDVAETLAEQNVDLEDAEIVLCGHSFGGKVALTFTKSCLAAGGRQPKATWVIDSNPGRLEEKEMRDRDQAQNPGLVIPIIESEVAAGSSYPDRNALISALESKYGLSLPLAQWVGQTVRRAADGGIEFAYNVPVLRAVYDDYKTADLWEVLEDSDARIGIVIAGKNRTAWGEDTLARLQRCGSNVQTSILEDAGHNVHVDDRPGLLKLLETSWR